MANKLLGTTDRVNTVCAYCGEAFMSDMDGTRPMARVAGDITAKIFCDASCLHHWEGKHCAWCGTSPLTGTLKVRLLTGEYFCEIAEMEGWQRQTKVPPFMPTTVTAGKD